MQLKNLPKRLSNIFDYFLKNKTTQNLPTHIIVELTNVCNLKCVMCPSPKQDRAKGYLNKETFIELINQVKGKIEVIDFDLYGEILINPDYDWYISYAKKHNLKTSVSTNATFLNKDHSERLIKSGLDFLIISIDDENLNGYNAIRKGADFQTIIENTKQFLRMNQGEIFTVIQKIHMSNNASATWNYVEEMSRFGANIVRLKPYRDLDKTMKNLRTQQTNRIEKIQCPYLWKIPVVTWNGEMVPCCNDYNATIPLGNVRDKDIFKIWNNDTFANLRQMHSEGRKEEINLCNGCSAIEFGPISLTLSAFFDGLNSRKIISVFQTLKILIKDL